MRVVIIGGHGRVALRLARLLSARGDSVTSVIRDPDQVDDVEATGATARVADVEALSTDELGEVLRGHDAVVWSAGAGGGNPARTAAVDRDAAIRSIDAAGAVGVDRYVMVSYFGAGPDHGVPEGDSFHAYAEAKAAADAHLRRSALAWTVLGPGTLSDAPGTGRIHVGAGAPTEAVPRDDVAAVAAAVLLRPETAGRTIDFVGGDTPIELALG